MKCAKDGECGLNCTTEKACFVEPVTARRGDICTDRDGDFCKVISRRDTMAKVRFASGPCKGREMWALVRNLTVKSERD